MIHTIWRVTWYAYVEPYFEPASLLSIAAYYKKSKDRADECIFNLTSNGCKDVRCCRFMVEYDGDIDDIDIDDIIENFSACGSNNV